jgi:hypothetical protein
LYEASIVAVFIEGSLVLIVGSFVDLEVSRLLVAMVVSKAKLASYRMAQSLTTR